MNVSRQLTRLLRPKHIVPSAAEVNPPVGDRDSREVMNEVTSPLVHSLGHRVEHVGSHGRISAHGPGVELQPHVGPPLLRLFTAASRTPCRWR